MTGGYISLSGRKHVSYKDVLKFIRTEWHLPYNAYLANINRKYILCVDVYVKEEKRLLLTLSGDLASLEEKINKELKQIIPLTYEIKINYKNPK